MVYTVKLLASHCSTEHAYTLKEEYGQRIIAQLNDETLAILNDTSKVTNFPYEVLERMVNADNAESACMKFYKWQWEGLGNNYLLGGLNCNLFMVIA